MKQVLGWGLCVVIIALAAASGSAWAKGFGHGHGSGADGLVPWMAMKMAPQGAIKSIYQADQSNLQSLHSAVHTAKQQLVQDLVAGKDTAADTQALQSAQNNLLAEQVKLAQSAMGTLSTTQRGQVTEFISQWQSMEQSQRSQRKALLQQYLPSPSASSSAAGKDVASATNR